VQESRTHPDGQSHERVSEGTEGSEKALIGEKIGESLSRLPSRESGIPGLKE